MAEAEQEATEATRAGLDDKGDQIHGVANRRRRSTMEQAYEVLIDLWQTGNRWARTAILFVVLGPLIGLGLALVGFNVLAAIATLVSFVSMVILPFIWPLVAGVVIAVLGRRPGGREVFRWLALYIGGLLTYGFYLYWIPISKDPVLVIPLVLAVGGWIFLTLGGATGPFFKWLMRGLILTIVVITAIFFIGGRGRVWQIPGQAVESARGALSDVVPNVQALQPEEFSVNAGEEKLTALNGSGTWHRIQANKTWVAFSYRSDGSRIEHQMPAGPSSWQGGAPEGFLRVKGLENETTLHFEKAR